MELRWLWLQRGAKELTKDGRDKIAQRRGASERGTEVETCAGVVELRRAEEAQEQALKRPTGDAGLGTCAIAWGRKRAAARAPV